MHVSNLVQNTFFYDERVAEHEGEHSLLHRVVHWPIKVGTLGQNVVLLTTMAQDQGPKLASRPACLLFVSKLPRPIVCCRFTRMNDSSGGQMRRTLKVVKVRNQST